VPTDDGYEQVVQNLSGIDAEGRRPTREFIMRDPFGVEKIRIDLGHVPGLLDAINSTPGYTPPAVRPLQAVS